MPRRLRLRGYCTDRAETSPRYGTTVDLVTFNVALTQFFLVGPDGLLFVDERKGMHLFVVDSTWLRGVVIAADAEHTADPFCHWNTPSCAASVASNGPIPRR